MDSGFNIFPLSSSAPESSGCCLPMSKRQEGCCRSRPPVPSFEAGHDPGARRLMPSAPLQLEARLPCARAELEARVEEAEQEDGGTAHGRTRVAGVARWRASRGALVRLGSGPNFSICGSLPPRTPKRVPI
jgi:hypothetical protein